MTFIKEINVPFMKIKKNELSTINNWSKVHWGKQSAIKNSYKRLIKDWFLDNETLPTDLHFEWQPVYKDNRKRDSINIAPTVKVFEDCLKEEGLIVDDDNTSHFLKSRKVDKSISDHRLVLKLYKRGHDD